MRWTRASPRRSRTTRSQRGFSLCSVRSAVPEPSPVRGARNSLLPRTATRLSRAGDSPHEHWRHSATKVAGTDSPDFPSAETAGASGLASKPRCPTRIAPRPALGAVSGSASIEKPVSCQEFWPSRGPESGYPADRQRSIQAPGDEGSRARPPFVVQAAVTLQCHIRLVATDWETLSLLFGLHLPARKRILRPVRD